MHPESVATYRIQMRSGFDFKQAAAVAPYLAALGISHFYASPYLQAAEGSTHGYDIVDPTRVDASLGGEEAHRHFCRALQSCGLFQMIDLVPNHMAITGRWNPWWWDVLENGPASRYAVFFDVNWQPRGECLPDKVLLPVLFNHYGRVLENGELSLCHSRGNFEIQCHDQQFPVNMNSLYEILARAAKSSGSALLAFLAECCAATPASMETRSRQDRSRSYSVLKQLLARLCLDEPETAGAIDQEVRRINSDPDALDALISRQNYRLSFWRSAASNLGYRRFFDINDLIGVRVEAAEVFAATHSLAIGWVRDGWVHGLRIDHPDGLWDPTAYFQRLREACPDTWIVAEKILEPGESLPPQWSIDGTTGYDFLNRAAGLFVNPQGLTKLTDIYEHYTGQPTDYQALVRHCKGLVLDELFSSELDRLSTLLADICRQHRRYQDYTRRELRDALYEIAVCFPVYRTYVRADRGIATEADKHYVAQAVAQAIKSRPNLDSQLMHFLEALLLLHITGPMEGELAMRFQQLTGSVMAKGVEDTTFYRFNRLICCNEVGADPDHYPLTPEQFHRDCDETLAHHPYTLLATSTHDTKRSEDVRARIALLSEIPENWAAALGRWTESNQRHLRGGAPDPNTAYLFYQTLVGAWPINISRLTAYMRKAVREAKAYTSWTQPDTAYENALHDYIEAVMADANFCADVEEFVAPLVLPGRINGLAQTLLKLTVPGVPDIYQGTELWALSLVDPDNRQPVDYTLRERLLAEINSLSIEEIMSRMDEGLPKLWLIRQALHLRWRRPELFGPQGTYRPVFARGSKAEHVVAYLRGKHAMTVVSRLILGLNGEWAGTTISLPSGRWRNILTGEAMPGDRTALDVLLFRFPVALLIKEE